MQTQTAVSSFTLAVGIWSVRHSGGPVLQGPNTRGCEVSGRATHQLGISNQAEDKDKLPAEVDCGIICKLLQIVISCVTICERYPSLGGKA